MKPSGFTLIEVMIVVAIIGILATVAIPAYYYYIAQSKTAEAHVNLNFIGKGAVSYFYSEHAYGDGMQALSHEWPYKDNAKYKNRTGYATSNDAIGNMPYKRGGSGSGVGIKANPADYAWQFDLMPWRDISFNIAEPFIYSYNYEGGQARIETDKNGSRFRGAQATVNPVYTRSQYFVASASACLLNNATCNKSNEQCDSGFIIIGGPSGRVSPILDNSDFTIEWQCGKAMISHVLGRTVENGKGNDPRVGPPPSVAFGL